MTTTRSCWRSCWTSELPSVLLSVTLWVVQSRFLGTPTKTLVACTIVDDHVVGAIEVSRHYHQMYVVQLNLGIWICECSTIA